MTRRRNSPSSATGEALAEPMKPPAVESMAEVRGDLGFFCCWAGNALVPERKRAKSAAKMIPCLMNFVSKNPGSVLGSPHTYTTPLLSRSAKNFWQSSNLNAWTRSSWHFHLSCWNPADRCDTVLVVTTSLYLAPVQRASGRSLVTLGLMNFLTRFAEKPGLFRPVLEQGQSSSPDAFGVTFEEARRSLASGEYEGLLKRLVERFKDLESKHDAVLCEGVDLGPIPSLGFDFNADLAHHLGTPVIAVTRCPATAAEVSDAVRVVVETFAQRRLSPAAV